MSDCNHQALSAITGQGIYTGPLPPFFKDCETHQATRNATPLPLPINSFQVFIMATAQLNAYTRADLTQAVTQILNSPKFWEVNPHIPVSSRNMVVRDIKDGVWGNIPIFSPYAATHGPYSQSKFDLFACTSPSTLLIGFTVRFRGTKLLVHRVTFRHMYGGQLSDTLELSHIFNCGIRSSSSVP